MHLHRTTAIKHHVYAKGYNKLRLYLLRMAWSPEYRRVYFKRVDIYLVLIFALCCLIRKIMG